MIHEKSYFRVIKDKTLSAKENMATDDALLSLYNDDDNAIFRVYSWEKSFTIGLSQKFENYSFSSLYKGNYAKRITGGGVLFHGHDLSYSLVIPSKLLDGLNIKESYEKICTFIINFYKKLGLDAKYVKDSEDITLLKNEFCQVGFEAYDILVNGKKIGGNAQRRTKKAIFQHGSIPIFKNNDKNNNGKIGYTLEDFGIKIDYEETKRLLIESFRESFLVETINSKLTLEEEKKKNLLLKEKYDIYSKAKI
ncbi:lipoate--protein ligase family protein [Arcobacteraceae bacterium]|nr:lipoate--protein ligase family protein [Arcobacteraceae bacterium]